jgi:hypothetical protein
MTDMSGVVNRITDQLLIMMSLAPAMAMRAKAATQQRTAAPVSRKPQQQQQVKQADLLGTDDAASTFNPFSTEASKGFDSDSFSKANSVQAPTNATASFDSRNDSFNRQAAKQEDIASMLSGLDFNSVPAPPPPQQQQQFANFTEAPVSPNPADEAVNERVRSPGPCIASRIILSADLYSRVDCQRRSMGIEDGGSQPQAA